MMTQSPKYSLVFALVISVQLVKFQQIFSSYTVINFFPGNLHLNNVFRHEKQKGCYVVRMFSVKMDFEACGIKSYKKNSSELTLAVS